VRDSIELQGVSKANPLIHFLIFGFYQGFMPQTESIACPLGRKF
jgi:hypothetical protein